MLGTLPEFDEIDFLLERKYPNALTIIRPQNVSTIDYIADVFIQRQKRDEKRARYKLELKALSKEDRLILYSEEYALYMKEKQEGLDANDFYNEPNALADFDHWSRVPYWTAEEAVALSFGKNPDIVTFKALVNHPYARHSSFTTKYKNMLRAVSRAIELQDIDDKCLPGNFITWAKIKEVTFPEELELLVAQRGASVSHWQKRCEQVQLECTELKQQIEALQSLHITNQAKPKEKPLSTLERNTMLKVILGMARSKYAYNPLAARNAASGKIQTDLAVSGISVNDDTIRKYLNEAKEIVDLQEDSF